MLSYGLYEIRNQLSYVILYNVILDQFEMMNTYVLAFQDLPR